MPATDHTDREKEKGKERERTVAFQNDYSLPISISFQSDNFQVNGVHENKVRDKGKRRGNSSRSGSSSSNSNNNNKENVTLQKFVTLREANGPSDETDI